MAHPVNSLDHAHMDQCIIIFLITVFFFLSSLNDKDSVRAGNDKALEQQLGHLCMIGGIFQNHNS